MNKESTHGWLLKVCRLAATAWLAASVAAVASADTEGAEAAVREQFRLAYAAAAIGVETADDDVLRGYALYPYLRAARLERALAGAQGADADAAAAEFLAQAGDAPVASIVRRALLQSLARRASWQAKPSIPPCFFAESPQQLRVKSCHLTIGSAPATAWHEPLKLTHPYYLRGDFP